MVISSQESIKDWSKPHLFPGTSPIPEVEWEDKYNAALLGTDLPNGTSDVQSSPETPEALREDSLEPGPLSDEINYKPGELLLWSPNMKLPKLKDPEDEIKVKDFLHRLAKQSTLALFKTGFEILQRGATKPITYKVMNGGSTEYLNTIVDFYGWRPWNDFPTYDDISEFTKSSAVLRKNFHEYLFSTMDLGDTVNDPLLNRFKAPATTSENNVYVELGPFFDRLNKLIFLANHEEEEDAEETLSVYIGYGNQAMSRRPNGFCFFKDPDKAAFWYNGTDILRSANEKDVAKFPREVPCLIVGDIKMAGKLPPGCFERVCHRGGETIMEVIWACNQIHDYMDMHHCRYGYVLTEAGGYMFRRREGGLWSHVDYSSFIPLQSTPEGELNFMMVLWYFHVKYALFGQDGGCVLNSCYDDCPIHLRTVAEAKDRKREEKRGKGRKNLK